jgi:hypothetical protein
MAILHRVIWAGGADLKISCIVFMMTLLTWPAHSLLISADPTLTLTTIPGFGATTKRNFDIQSGIEHASLALYVDT